MTGKLHKLKVRSHFHHCIFCNSKESIVLYRGIVICAECYLKVTKKTFCSGNSKENWEGLKKDSPITSDMLIY